MPTANEISRKTLGHLAARWPDHARFQEMVVAMGVDEKDLSNNLFWLEEHRLVKLATILPVGSNFPQIVTIKLTPEGEETAADPMRLDRRFPLTYEVKTPQGAMTYRKALEKIRDHIETVEGLDLERRQDLLRCADEILAVKELDQLIKI